MVEHYCEDRDGNLLKPGDRVEAMFGKKATVVRIIAPDHRGKGRYIAKYDDGWGDPDSPTRNRCFGFNARKIEGGN